MNRDVRFPDNASESGPLSILMRQRDGNTVSRPAGAEWPRRVVVALWALAFFVGGGVLSASWDTLMTRLARPPVGPVAGGGTPR